MEISCSHKKTRGQVLESRTVRVCVGVIGCRVLGKRCTTDAKMGRVRSSSKARGEALRAESLLEKELSSSGTPFGEREEISELRREEGWRGKALTHARLR